MYSYCVGKKQAIGASASKDIHTKKMTGISSLYKNSNED